jgi:hypothetical protein
MLSLLPPKCVQSQQINAFIADLPEKLEGFSGACSAVAVGLRHDLRRKCPPLFYAQSLKEGFASHNMLRQAKSVKKPSPKEDRLGLILGFSLTSATPASSALPPALPGLKAVLAILRPLCNFKPAWHCELAGLKLLVRANCQHGLLAGEGWQGEGGLYNATPKPPQGGFIAPPLDTPPRPWTPRPPGKSRINKGLFNFSCKT